MRLDGAPGHDGSSRGAQSRSGSILLTQNYSDPARRSHGRYCIRTGHLRLLATNASAAQTNSSHRVCRLTVQDLVGKDLTDQGTPCAAKGLTKGGADANTFQEEGLSVSPNEAVLLSLEAPTPSNQRQLAS
mgnify:CR=1 FL=1